MRSEPLKELFSDGVQVAALSVTHGGGISTVNFLNTIARLGDQI